MTFKNGRKLVKFRPIAVPTKPASESASAFTRPHRSTLGRCPIHTARIETRGHCGSGRQQRESRLANPVICETTVTADMASPPYSSEVIRAPTYRIDAAGISRCPLCVQKTLADRQCPCVRASTHRATANVRIVSPRGVQSHVLGSPRV